MSYSYIKRPPGSAWCIIYVNDRGQHLIRFVHDSYQDARKGHAYSQSIRWIEAEAPEKFWDISMQACKVGERSWNMYLYSYRPPGYKHIAIPKGVL